MHDKEVLFVGGVKNGKTELMDGFPYSVVASEDKIEPLVCVGKGNEDKGDVYHLQVLCCQNGDEMYIYYLHGIDVWGTLINKYKEWYKEVEKPFPPEPEPFIVANRPGYKEITINKDGKYLIGRYRTKTRAGEVYIVFSDRDEVTKVKEATHDG